MADKPERILVIRPEKLGDLVVATPVFRALRHSYPEALITVLTDRVYGVILSENPHVDEVITINWKWRDWGEHESILSIVSKLRPHRFDTALILYPNWSGWNVIVSLSGIGKVFQLGGTWAAFLLGHKIIRRRVHQRQLHYRDYYLEVASRAGAGLSVGDQGDPCLYLKDEERINFLNRFPRTEGVKRIILHPFGHGSSPNYSVHSYAELSLRIARELGIEVWLTGWRGDLASWPEISHQLIRKEWLGTLSLREMMVACASVDAVICGSTGIIHLAAALGTPTIGLYCPHPGSHPKAWGPLGYKTHNIVVSESLCRKLHPSKSTCSGNNSCDLICGISQEQVMLVLKGSIESPREKNKTGTL